MWCRQCGQDVPAVPRGPARRPHCLRCDGSLETTQAGVQVATELAACLAAKGHVQPAAVESAPRPVPVDPALAEPIFAGPGIELVAGWQLCDEEAEPSNPRSSPSPSPALASTDAHATAARPNELGEAVSQVRRLNQTLSKLRLPLPLGQDQAPQPAHRAARLPQGPGPAEPTPGGTDRSEEGHSPREMPAPRSEFDLLPGPDPTGAVESEIAAEPAAPTRRAIDAAWKLWHWDRRIQSWERMLDRAASCCAGVRPPARAKALRVALRAAAAETPNQSGPNENRLPAARWRRELADFSPAGGPGQSHPAAPSQASAWSLVVAEAIRKRFPWLGWLMLSAGMAGFACGLVLVGWSIASGRSDLWDLGVPLTLVGQVGLLLGVILQLDRLWQDRSVDDEAAPRRGEPTISTKRSAPAWYVDAAEDPPLPMALDEISQRLDDLSRRLGEVAS